MNAYSFTILFPKHQWTLWYKLKLSKLIFTLFKTYFRISPLKEHSTGIFVQCHNSHIIENSFENFEIWFWILKRFQQIPMNPFSIIEFYIKNASRIYMAELRARWRTINFLRKFYIYIFQSFDVNIRLIWNILISMESLSHHLSDVCKLFRF